MKGRKARKQVAQAMIETAERSTARKQNVQRLFPGVDVHDYTDERLIGGRAIVYSRLQPKAQDTDPTRVKMSAIGRGVKVGDVVVVTTTVANGTKLEAVFQVESVDYDKVTTDLWAGMVVYTGYALQVN